MKKFFSLCLASLLVLSLVACHPSNWHTKNMRTPDVRLSTQQVGFVSGDGEVVQANAVVSPLTKTTFIPDVALGKLQQLDFLKGWHVDTNYQEKANASFVGTQQYLNISATTQVDISEFDPAGAQSGTSIHLAYLENVSSAIGYTAIQVNIDSENQDALSQAQIFEVLKAVFGEEYANYLCYAKMTQQDECASAVIESELGNVVFSRLCADSSYTFSMGIQSDNNRGYIDSFKPALHPLRELSDIYGWHESGVHDIKNLGTEFLAQHYGDGTHFEPGSFVGEKDIAYIYYANNDEQTLILSYDIAQPGVSTPLTAYFAVSMKGDVVETYCTFDVGTLDQNTTDERREEMRQSALAIVADILGTEVVGDPFEEGSTHILEVDGVSRLVIFNYVDEAQEQASHTAKLIVTTSTNLNPTTK